MQNIEQLARELGAALQLQPEYVRVVAAQEQNDADEGLQANMQELGLVRMQYQHEAAKGDDADEALMGEYQTKFQGIYDTIMQNPNMEEYQAATKELDAVVQYVSAILDGCAQGEDPATYEPKPAGCGCSCEECGGGCGG